MLNEYLTKTAHSLQFAGNDLQSAIKHATAVDAIVILSILRDVREAETRINEYIGALEADGRQDE